MKTVTATIGGVAGFLAGAPIGYYTGHPTGTDRVLEGIGRFQHVPHTSFALDTVAGRLCWPYENQPPDETCRRGIARCWNPWNPSNDITADDLLCAAGFPERREGHSVVTK